MSRQCSDQRRTWAWGYTEASLYPSFAIYWLWHDKGTQCPQYTSKTNSTILCFGCKIKCGKTMQLYWAFSPACHRSSVNISHDNVVPRLDFKVRGFYPGSANYPPTQLDWCIRDNWPLIVAQMSLSNPLEAPYGPWSTGEGRERDLEALSLLSFRQYGSHKILFQREG